MADLNARKYRGLTWLHEELVALRVNGRVVAQSGSATETYR